MKRNRKPLVLIRTDGNNKIGMGHIYRSISISKQLKKFGFKTNFLITKNKIIKKKLEGFGKCYYTNNNQVYEISIIKKLRPDIIIVDLLQKFFPHNYKFFKSIKKLCKLLVTIDFTGKGTEYANLGIHSIFSPKKYKAKRVYNDIKFSAIRKEFVNARKKFRVHKKVKSIIVLQGGSDTKCVSPKIIQAIDKIKKPIKLTLILGPSFECKKELQRIVKNIHLKIKILKDVNKIFDEMIKHDIAITAGGITMIELMAIGIPSVVIYGDKHELEIVKFAHRKKAIINFGYGPYLSKKLITKKLESVLRDYNLRKLLNTNSKKIVDGKGVDRVVQLISKNYELVN